MEKVRLYLDADVNPLLAKVLRERGIDVLTAQDAGMKGASDEEQLQFATQQERSILTHNVKHFPVIAKEYAEKALNHQGIIASDQVEFKELLRRTLKLLSVYSKKEMINRFEWLQNFK